MQVLTVALMGMFSSHLGMDNQFFWNITLMVGAIRCFSIPFFARRVDTFHHQKMCVWDGLIGALSAFSFFMALDAQNT